MSAIIADAGLQRLGLEPFEKTGFDRRRWGTVAHNLKVKVRIKDMDALLDAYPEYELWIWKREVDPSKGQISPAYTEADLKLAGQEVGSR